MYTIINLKDYDIKADGKHNDAPLLREIFSKIKGYAEIIFPEGTIMLGDGGTEEILLRLENARNVILRGVPGKTKLMAHPDTPVVNRMGILHLHKCEYCEIYDLELDGNSQARSVKNGGKNWGDESAKVDDCSNINIDGSNYITIKRVYSHHPVIDCLITSRYGGGNTPANHHLLIEDCIFDYGYRQGISIAGTDHGVIRNCKITNTSKALDLLKNDGVSTIGTSPRAGIDSETWIWNHDWIIEGCYFENNAGGHINMNDGASEHIIRNNRFVGGGAIGCETPSSGTRTINNIITNNHFINSSISSLHGAFVISDNVFFYDNTNDKKISVAKLVLADKSHIRGGNILFTNNKISVDLDAYIKAGVDLSEINAQLYFGSHVIATNNTFHNLLSTAPINMANARALMFTNNTFTSSVDMTKYITEPSIITPSDAIVSNNSFQDSSYPSKIRDAYNTSIDCVRFSKNGNRFSKNINLNIYNNRKIFFKIANFNEMTNIFAKVVLRVGASSMNSTPYTMTYDISSYRKNNQLVQTINQTETEGGMKLINCLGMILKDGILYLGIANHFDTSSHDVNIDFEIIDSSATVSEVINLHAQSYYERIISPYDTKIESKQYNVGDIVRSHKAGGGIYLYEVVVGGVINKASQLDYPRDYNVDGVVFKYIGQYRGDQNE